jgi:hypothetical protein
MKQTNKWKNALILLALAVALAIPANAVARASVTRPLVIKTGVYHGDATFRVVATCDYYSCGLITAQGKITIRVSAHYIGKTHIVYYYGLTGGVSLVGGLHPNQPPSSVGDCSIQAPNGFTARGSYTWFGTLTPIGGGTKFHASLGGWIGGSFNLSCVDPESSPPYAYTDTINFGSVFSTPGTGGISQGGVGLDSLDGLVDPSILTNGGIIRMGKPGTTGLMTISIPKHH